MYHSSPGESIPTVAVGSSIGSRQQMVTVRPSMSAQRHSAPWAAAYNGRPNGDGIRGKAMTPHLLAFVARVTQKRSLAANRVLALHNAAFAAELATALSALPPLG